MSGSEYAVRYFCGPLLRDVPEDLLKQELERFHGDYAMPLPPVGDIGIRGAAMDFNAGLRLQVPEGNYHVVIADHESNLVVLDEDVSAVVLVSMEKFFVCWEVQIYQDGALVFSHFFEGENQRVHFMFTAHAMGDNLALFPYMEEFQRRHGCRISCTVPEYMRDLAAAYYPGIEQRDGPDGDTYATYYLAAWVNMPICSTEDARALPLLQIGETILRVPMPVARKFRPKAGRRIAEPYVCIGVQASTPAKAWLNPNGWDMVIAFLKQMGYRVLCIDRDRECAGHGLVMRMPEGAEDFTGNLPLMERAEVLAHAEFFIGLGSGLSWLAWSLDIPVVLISGFSSVWCEFQTPYRVMNPLVCHGCFNDVRVDYGKCNACPYYGGTERAYECSRKISAQQVMDAIQRVLADLQERG